MANSVSNVFSDFGVPCVSVVKGVSVSERIYREPSTRAGGQISVLFLSSDSGAKIRRVVERQSTDYAKGALSCYRKNVKELPETASDDHLKNSIVKSFNAGGYKALSVMLGLAEEEHAIQAACDMCEGASLEKYANVRLSEVSKRIAENKPDIFHFSGHLEKDKGLAFCKTENAISSKAESDYMDKRSLIACFKKQKVELAVIASCNSATYAKALVESSVAKMAIGSANSVEDLETIKFVQMFYSELTNLIAKKAQGLSTSIQKAFSAAEKSVSPFKCHMLIFPEAAKVLTPIGVGDNLFNPGVKRLSAAGSIRRVYNLPRGSNVENSYGPS